jgi:hypothetical protein
VATPALVSSAAGQVAATAAHHDRFYVYALGILTSSVLMVPAIFGVMALLRDRLPRWAFLAGAVTQFGMLTAIGDSAGELVFWQVGAPGADRAQMVALTERYDDALGSSLVYAVGGLASLIGMAALAVGLWRCRVVPWWAGVLLLVATVANVQGFALASKPVLLGSYVVLLAAFAPMAAALVRRAPAELPAARQAGAAVPA